LAKKRAHVLTGKIGELRGRKIGKQKPPEFYRIRILMYLTAFKESNISDFRTKGEGYGIIMNKGDLKNLLDKMIREKWIKKSEYKIYSLDEKGQRMKDYVRSLLAEDENHPLFDCESFDGIGSIGFKSPDQPND